MNRFKISVRDKGQENNGNLINVHFYQFEDQQTIIMTFISDNLVPEKQFSSFNSTGKNGQVELNKIDIFSRATHVKKTTSL